MQWYKTAISYGIPSGEDNTEVMFQEHDLYNSMKDFAIEEGEVFSEKFYKSIQMENNDKNKVEDINAIINFLKSYKEDPLNSNIVNFINKNTDIPTAIQAAKNKYEDRLPITQEVLWKLNLLFINSAVEQLTALKQAIEAGLDSDFDFNNY